ncbi:MAG: hypothetical protein FGM62_01940 [Methylobacterium sp.]|nr:hypothetical protein [Methylobacterium sp.]
MNQLNTRTYQLLLISSAFLAGVVILWGLGALPLMSFNEARRAIPTAGMVASGDWLLPVLNGQLYISKPPLLYWLAGGFSAWSGEVNEWTLRLPSAITAGAVAIAVYLYARSRFGAWPALFALQILVANATFAMLARRAEIEMLLSGLCFLSLLAAFRYLSSGEQRRWLRLSYVMLGLAVLAKGPVALLFVTLPLLILAAAKRERRYWRVFADPLSWVLLLVIGASWYVLVSWHLGFDIWASTLHKDILNKVHSGGGEHALSYALWMLADFLPFSLLLFKSPVDTIRRWWADEQTAALLIALLVPFLVFSAFSDKHTKYLLPVYPVLSLLLGKLLGEIFVDAPARLRRAILACMIAMPAGYAVYYAAIEKSVFSYRYQALPEFAAWVETRANYPVYAFGHVDERLVYYAGGHLPELDKIAFAGLKSRGAYVLVENDGADPKPTADCVVRQFKPYLKRNKSLTVLGFGPACSSGQPSRINLNPDQSIS